MRGAARQATSLLRVLGRVLRRPAYATLCAVTFGLSLIGYLMILPADFTGGRIGWATIRFVTLRTGFFATLFAALLALSISVAAYAWRHGVRARAVSSGGGIVLAVLTPLLCCSPLLPAVLSAVAAVLPAASRANLPIQGFLATHQTLLYASASVLLAIGLYGNTRRVLLCKR